MTSLNTCLKSKPQAQAGGANGAVTANHLLRLDHLFDARQMVWQMAKVALGRRVPCGAVSVADSQRITSCFCLGDSRLKAFESQLTLIGVQLLGPLAIESMPQLGDQVIRMRWLPGKATPLRNMPSDQAILLGHLTNPRPWRQALGHNPRLHFVRPTSPPRWPIQNLNS